MCFYFKKFITFYTFLYKMLHLLKVTFLFLFFSIILFFPIIYYFIFSHSFFLGLVKFFRRKFALPWTSLEVRLKLNNGLFPFFFWTFRAKYHSSVSDNVVQMMRWRIFGRVWETKLIATWLAFEGDLEIE